MERSRLQAQLILDEGVRFTVYADPRGLPTVGIGHLVRRDDHLTLGDPVTPEQVAAWFDTDLTHALAACQTLFPTWEGFPDEVQEVLANMCFQLGRGGLAKFRKALAAIKNHDWPQAAHEMRDSLWYRQTPHRAERLALRLEKLEV